MRGAVTAIQGQKQDAQGGRIRWRYLPFGFSDLLIRVNQPRGKHFKILAREITCPDSPLHGSSWAQPLSTVNSSNLCRLGPQAPVRRARKPTARNRSYALLRWYRARLCADTHLPTFGLCPGSRHFPGRKDTVPARQPRPPS